MEADFQKTFNFYKKSQIKLGNCPNQEKKKKKSVLHACRPTIIGRKRIKAKQLYKSLCFIHALGPDQGSMSPPNQWCPQKLGELFFCLHT